MKYEEATLPCPNMERHAVCMHVYGLIDVLAQRDTECCLAETKVWSATKLEQ